MASRLEVLATLSYGCRPIGPPWPADREFLVNVRYGRLLGHHDVKSGCSATNEWLAPQAGRASLMQAHMCCVLSTKCNQKNQGSGRLPAQLAVILWSELPPHLKLALETTWLLRLSRSLRRLDAPSRTPWTPTTLCLMAGLLFLRFPI
jgi:hypothetical protein